MTSATPAVISELARRLKEAGPLDSPALAAKIAEQVDALRELPHIAESARLSAAQVADATKDWASVLQRLQVQEPQLRQAAEYIETLTRDPNLLENLERAAHAAQQLQLDQAALTRTAEQLKQLQASGVLEILAKYQQQMAEMVAVVKKLVEGQR